MDSFITGSTAYTEMIFLDANDEPVEVVNPRVDRIFVGPPEETLTTDATPVHDGGGHYTYSAEAGAVGVYRDYWTADGGYASSEFFEVTAIASDVPAGSSICNLWATVDDLPEECSGLDPDVAADMLLVASELLYEKSGRQYPGICEATVWPCSQRVSGCFPSRPSRCTWGRSYSIVTLGIQPIIEVSEVIIDGEILDPSLYRIDNYRELVRLDNADGTSDVWPRDDETFKVTFTYGQSPPNLGVLAAAALACQLGLRFTGSDDCKLPDNVQSISRQGVTMTLINEFNSVQQLGIAEVGLFLDTYNPKGLRRRAMVWSPDMDRVRRVGT